MRVPSNAHKSHRSRLLPGLLFPGPRLHPEMRVHILFVLLFFFSFFFETRSQTCYAVFKFSILLFQPVEHGGYENVCFQQVHR